ncbi:uncharacterized protein LOC112128468 [Cimex lectularius]|uniref:Uncharacterized protein n=1 Tax=Cimex lectularius TaxID=79782 RepID=A0A8I6TKT6_CIMLE|nr:uncharacterized protein LOC112127591 [Cimex lectularius]XP_024086470.1 uncharacterized protein LOC112128468 [Cimex lectularius]
MKPSTINACWRKIWPQVVKKDNAFPPLQDEEKEIVRIAHQIGGEGFDDMRADEIDELLNSHEKELSDEDLMLQKEEDSKECEEVESEDESRGGEKSPSFSAKQIREILTIRDQLVQKTMDLDPSLNRSLQFKRDVEAASIPYVEMLKELNFCAKKRTISSYFLPSTSKNTS